MKTKEWLAAFAYASRRVAMGRLLFLRPLVAAPRRVLCSLTSWEHLGERARAKVASDIESGVRLIVVPSPLGESSDVSFRAVAALSLADFVACEDTRKAGILLSSLGIARRQRLVRHDAMMAKESAELLVREMELGRVVALTCDAGTPGISDPGAYLVDLAARRGLKVVGLPGPCAAATAISVCGLDTSKGFCFLGFVASRSAASRKRELEAALGEAELRPVVLYESAKRLSETVSFLADLDPARTVFIAKELTKIHQDLWRGSLADASAWLLDAGSSRLRGEFTIVIDGKPRGTTEDIEPLAKRRLNAKRAAGLSLSAAARAVAAELDLKRSYLYDLALRDDKIR